MAVACAYMDIQVRSRARTKRDASAEKANDTLPRPLTILAGARGREFFFFFRDVGFFDFFENREATRTERMKNRKKTTPGCISAGARRRPNARVSIVEKTSDRNYTRPYCDNRP